MSDPFGPLRYYPCDERVPETIVEHLRDHRWIFMFQSRDEFAMFLANEIEIPRQEVTRLRSLLRQKDMEIERLRARVEELESLARELAEGDASRDEITRYRAGLKKIVEGDGFWDAPSLARDLLEGKDVT